MPNRRDIRRLAMQILYQLDLRGSEDQPAIREGLEEGPDAPGVCQAALELAEAAWACRANADALVLELAPQWPTHRQPPLDRAILRLACHEMVSGYSPVKVAINEAVELSKLFCAEQSPPFINGVLDKIARQLMRSDAPPPSAAAPPLPDDQWLRDATNEGTPPSNGEES